MGKTQKRWQPNPKDMSRGGKRFDHLSKAIAMNLSGCWSGQAAAGALPHICVHVLPIKYLSRLACWVVCSLMVCLMALQRKFYIGAPKRP